MMTRCGVEVDETRCEQIMSRFARKQYLIEYDDAMQEYRIVLQRALELWDPSKGASFYTYLTSSLYLRSGVLMRPFVAPSSIPPHMRVSLDAKPMHLQARSVEDEAIFSADLSGTARRVAGLILAGETRATSWASLLNISYAEALQAKRELAAYLRP